MKKTLKYLVLLSALWISGCSKDNPVVENPSGETFIYNLQIVNGGMTGAGKYDGVYNEADKSYTFTIPAESDIAALKFEGKLSLGAHLDPDTYDFSQASGQSIKIVNVENSATYDVTVNLSAPIATPLLDKVKIRTDAGLEVDGVVNHNMMTVFLGVPDEAQVTLVSSSYLPKRAEATFTKLTGDKISAADPGTVKLDFLGLTSEYKVSFEDVPTFGAEWDTPTLYDFSDNPAAGDKPADFSGQLTRSADFDGDHVMVVSRVGGSFVKLFALSDLKAGNAGNAKTLNMAGVTGGTYTVSAGRIVNGHVYACNLTTGIANSAAGLLKIYHWADADARAEKVVEFNGTVDGNKIVAGRFGDNISVNLDENGNGYIYLIEHATGAPTLRFTVTGYSKVDNPVSITAPFAASYYSCYNQVDGSDNEFLYTGSSAPLALIDKDGNVLYKMASDAIPILATEARIFRFNNERYLMISTGRKTTSQPDTEILVYNISDGASTVMALRNFEASADKTPIFRYSLNGKNLGTCAANCAWAIRDDGRLYLFGSYCDAGFALAEFEKKR